MLLERVHRALQRSGAHLDDCTRVRLRALTYRMAALKTVIKARLASGREAAAVHVTNLAELAGLGIRGAVPGGSAHGCPDLHCGVEM